MWNDFSLETWHMAANQAPPREGTRSHCKKPCGKCALIFSWRTWPTVRGSKCHFDALKYEDERLEAIRGFPKMVVPTFHTPKWSFLVGKPWSLGTTILGNPHKTYQNWKGKACEPSTSMNFGFQPYFFFQGFFPFSINLQGFFFERVKIQQGWHWGKKQQE